MRTFISRSLLFSAALFLVSLAQAAEPVRTGNAEKRNHMERTLDRALNKHLSFPAASKANMLGDVYVSFVIDKVGRVQVLDLRADNEQLKEYVLRKLARIDIGENPEGIWKTTHMHITFRPQRA